MRASHFPTPSFMPSWLTGLCLVLALLCVAGCATSDEDGMQTYRLSYLRARWLDTADIVDLGYGMGLGVVANATVPGDVTMSVGGARCNHYRHAQRRYDWRRDWHVGLPFSPIWRLDVNDEPNFEGWHCDAELKGMIPGGITLHAWKSAGSDIIRSHPHPSEAWQKVSKYARAHVGLGAVGYLGFGVNFLEIVDFLVGWTMLDIAGDDSHTHGPEGAKAITR